MSDYKIGNMVRLMQVSPYLYCNAPIANETAAFFEQCLGNVFRVEGFDNGQLELWASAEGKHQQEFSTDMHVIWIEPEYVELVSVGLV